MACVHEQHAPSPSLSGFSTPLSEHPFCRPDSEVPASTPDTELTPTQCVLRNVLSIDPVGGGSGNHSNSPTLSDEPTNFANSVLKMQEGGAEGGAVRNQTDSFRLQAGGGGFLEGLFGCLKPVWTMIGKAYTTEHKQSHEGEYRSRRLWSFWMGIIKSHWKHVPLNAFLQFLLFRTAHFKAVSK